MNAERELTEHTTPPRFSGTLTSAVCLSKELIKGLLAEFHKRDLSRRKPQSEALGLLFGPADPTSVRLEQFQPVEVGDFATSTPETRERLHKALGERISEIRSSSSENYALVGWYVLRLGGAIGPLDRDIDIHNTFFRSSRDTALIVRLEAEQHIAVEVYSAKPGCPLSKNDHRAGSWSSTKLDALPERVDVPLADSGDDELFLNVYRTAKSLDEAEYKRSWQSIRRFMAGLMPTVRIPRANTGPDSRFGTGLKRLRGNMHDNASQFTAPRVSTDIEWTLPSKALVLRISDHALAAIERDALQERERQPELCSGGLLLGSRERSPFWRFTIQRHVPVEEWDTNRGGAPFVTEGQSRTMKTLASWPSDLAPIGFYRTSREDEGKRSYKAADSSSFRRYLMQADASLLNTFLIGESALGVILLIDTSTLEPRASVLREDGKIYELVSRASETRALVRDSSIALPSSFSADRLPAEQASRQSSETTLTGYNLPDRTNTLRLSAWILGTVVVSLFTYVCAHMYLKPLLLKLVAANQTQSEPSKPGRASEQVAQQNMLSLRVDPRSNGVFEVSWNPDSPPIQSAIVGTLWMTNSTHFLRAIDLSADELRSGRIMYMSVSADITFHLKVTDKAGRETTEWVRVLNDAGPKNTSRFDGVMKSGLPPKPEPGVKPTRNAGGKPADAALKDSGIASVIQLKPSDSPSGPRGAADAHALVLPRNDTPKVDLFALPAVYLQRLVYTLTSLGLPKAPKSPQPLETSTQIPITIQTRPQPKLLLSDPSSANQNPRTQAYPPRILFQYVPSLPLRADEHVDAFVAVLVKISNAGKVTDVTLAHGDKNMPRYLADFAISAARKWQFSPATVNGTPVAASMTIQFHFTPPK
jgi:TonB family protein